MLGISPPSSDRDGQTFEFFQHPYAGNRELVDTPSESAVGTRQPGKDTDSFPCNEGRAGLTHPVWLCSGPGPPGLWPSWTTRPGPGGVVRGIR